MRSRSTVNGNYGNLNEIRGCEAHHDRIVGSLCARKVVAAGWHPAPQMTGARRQARTVNCHGQSRQGALSLSRRLSSATRQHVGKKGQQTGELQLADPWRRWPANRARSAILTLWVWTPSRAA